MSEDECRALKYTLKAHGVAPNSSFFKALGEAVGHYRTARAIKSCSRPAAVRRYLGRMVSTAEKLEKLAAEPDANTARILREAGLPATEIEAAVNALLRPLEQARQKANHYPQQGRLPELDRLHLAVDVAKAFVTHLGITPAATHEGAYEETLVHVLAFATGDEPSDVHDLARRACDQIRESQAKNLFE